MILGLVQNLHNRRRGEQFCIHDEFVTFGTRELNLFKLVNIGRDKPNTKTLVKYILPKIFIGV